MVRKKKRSFYLEFGKRMPPLYQPLLLNFVKDQLKSAGYITYDATTGKWTGVDYKKRGDEKC